MGIPAALHDVHDDYVFEGDHWGADIAVLHLMRRYANVVPVFFSRNLGGCPHVMVLGAGRLVDNRLPKKPRLTHPLPAAACPGSEGEGTFCVRFSRKLRGQTTCNGDSGGPWFEDRRLQGVVVRGLHVARQPPRSRCGDPSSYAVAVSMADRKVQDFLTRAAPDLSWVDV